MQAAFFDVDGTLASSNIVGCFVDFQMRRLPPARRALWLALLLPKLPYYALVDRIDRGRFNQLFFESYRDIEVSQLKSWAEESGEAFWTSHLFAEAVTQVGQHRAQGERIVLVSGGVEETLRPLTHLLAVDDLVCAQLKQRGTRFTGRLQGRPISGQAKAAAVQQLAGEWGLDLSQCYAYGDSYADGEFLGCVGHPVPVNPDRALKRLAAKKGWETVTWRSHTTVSD